MPPVDRRNPIRAESSESTINVVEFFREYPDDETCLNYIWRERFAADGEHAYCERCEQPRVFKRYDTSDKRPAWFCSACGFRIHPLKGTIFEKSSTSLQLWFFAMYLMASTRCGISAKQLERELGVTYKTAWRMFNLIRNQLMADDDSGPLSGHVEADETLIGGQTRNSHRREREALGWDRKRYDNERKDLVFAAVERDGRVRATVIPNSSGPTLRKVVTEYVAPGSTLYTDEYSGYRSVDALYDRRTIRHRDRIYAIGSVHTQTVEGFFSLLKNAIEGVHHGVSVKRLQGYLNEYTWRYNRRHDTPAIFRDLIAASASDRA
jgi:transposase-like protein